MPYVAINTVQQLSTVQKEKIKAELGRLICLIPTKNEAGLLVDFSDGRTMYRAGEEVPAAFIDVRLYTKAALEPKKAFTQAAFDLLARELGIKKEHMYLNIIELENWGGGGALK
jgi:phenylpyruvate tautomerase PptA (4-oxalocrotonate tautomerase family)